MIITDAGFHNEWFKEVTKLGWDYIGRVRGQKVYCQNEKWLRCQELMLTATGKPIQISRVILCKTNNSLETQFFLFKGKAKIKKSYGQHKSRRGGRDKKNHRRSALEPWLLASSLNIEAEKVMLHLMINVLNHVPKFELHQKCKILQIFVKHESRTLRNS